MVALVLGVSIGGASAAFGDQVVASGANRTGALVVGLEDGRLQFRTAAGRLHEAWVDDVDLLIVDRGGAFADFNQAERYLSGGEPDRAIDRYRRALRLAEGFWQDLILARLVMVCDRAKRLDESVGYFVQLIDTERAGPALAARLMPKSIPTKRDKAVTRAIDELDAALSGESDAEKVALFKLLRYDCLRRTGDGRAAGAAPGVATLDLPPSARLDRAYSIQLTAMEAVLADAVEPQVWESLERAIRWAPEEVLPNFLLLKGRTLLHTAKSEEEIIRASWPFMRVAIHMPEDPRAADGLYGAALALERIGRHDKATALLEECLGHKRLKESTGKSARAALERLRPADDS
jgi:tetratricopeptide (TPR) repeat protein